MRHGRLLRIVFPGNAVILSGKTGKTTWFPEMNQTKADSTEKISDTGRTAPQPPADALTRIDPASVAADSHRGLVRRNNEDSFFYALNPDGSRLIAAVADGIGGNENGEIASSLVCKMLLMRWRALTASGGPAGSGDAANFLKHAILKINSALFRINESDNSKPMGTTLAVMMAGENWMVSAHCGDSRLYRLRAGEFTLLTNDHSLVNEMVQSNEAGRKLKSFAIESLLFSLKARIFNKKKETDSDEIRYKKRFCAILQSVEARLKDFSTAKQFVETDGESQLFTNIDDYNFVKEYWTSIIRYIKSNYNMGA